MYTQRQDFFQIGLLTIQCHFMDRRFHLCIFMFKYVKSELNGWPPQSGLVRPFTKQEIHSKEKHVSNCGNK